MGPWATALVGPSLLAVRGWSAAESRRRPGAGTTRWCSRSADRTRRR